MARLIVILILLFSVGIVAAQDEDTECDAVAGQQSIVDMLASVPTDTVEGWLQGIVAVKATISVFENSCGVSLKYDSEQNGQLPVIGPVVLRDGIYRMILRTSGAAIVDVEALSGECDTDGFAVFSEQATDGAETLLETSEGCLALISVENAREPWELFIEPIFLN